jgi:hypothetical protein
MPNPPYISHIKTKSTTKSTSYPQFLQCCGMHGLKMQGIDAAEMPRPSNMGITQGSYSIDDICVIFKGLFRKFLTQLTPQISDITMNTDPPTGFRVNIKLWACISICDTPCESIPLHKVEN